MKLASFHVCTGQLYLLFYEISGPVFAHFSVEFSHFFLLICRSSLNSLDSNLFYGQDVAISSTPVSVNFDWYVLLEEVLNVVKTI